jgi:hypothetical protein
MGRLKQKQELLRELGEGRVKFFRPELLGLYEELETIYNALTSVGKEPSDKVRRLIVWVGQEAAVVNDPSYDGSFKCSQCGYGDPDFVCPQCKNGEG